MMFKTRYPERHLHGAVLFSCKHIAGQMRHTLLQSYTAVVTHSIYPHPCEYSMIRSSFIIIIRSPPWLFRGAVDRCVNMIQALTCGEEASKWALIVLMVVPMIM